MYLFVGESRSEFLMCVIISVRPNPFQIRWSTYAYATDHFGIKVFMFFSKNYLRRIFLFFCFIKISCVQRYRRIPTKFLLRTKIFQCNFQTATASPVFYAFKRVIHNFSQFWALFHVLYVIKKKNKCTSYALFTEKCTF